jgi:superoxide dismutase
MWQMQMLRLKNTQKSERTWKLCWQMLTAFQHDIRQAVINNGGGHLNHALFWELLSPEKQEPTVQSVLAAIEEAFGSFDDFKAAFTQAATTRFGSGWAWLVVNERWQT